jgi:hypothetical protein
MYRNIRFMGQDLTAIELAIYIIFAIVLTSILWGFIAFVALVARLLFS